MRSARRKAKAQSWAARYPVLRNSDSTLEIRKTPMKKNEMISFIKGHVLVVRLDEGFGIRQIWF